MLTNALTCRPANTYPANDHLFRMVDRLFGEWPGGHPTSTTGWTPATDIRESEEAFTVIAELPGLAKKDVDVTLENNVLTVRGERRFENDDNQDNYHRVERTYGRFQRSFTLPNGIDAANVSATFDHGLLTLTVPKAETARARTIKVA